MNLRGYITPKQDILKSIEEERWQDLKTLTSEWRAKDLAILLSTLNVPEAQQAYEQLHHKNVFAYLDDRIQKRIMIKATKEERTRLFLLLPPDDKTMLLSRLPQKIANEIIISLPQEEQMQVQELLEYPENTVGRLMTHAYVTLDPRWSVEEALDYIKQTGRKSETINHVYVVNKEGVLLDDLRLRKIFFANNKQKIKSLMDNIYVTLSPYDEQTQAVHVMRKYDIHTIPVINEEGKLIGIVTADDVFDVAEAQATKDIQKIASVIPLKESYKHASIFSLYNRRVWWLSILVLVGMVSAGVISRYEEVLASAIALSFFIPLLLGSGGNAGSQSATIIVRAIATGDLQKNEWLRVFFKEIGTGLLIGTTLGIIAGLIGVFQGGAIIGLIVGLTMIAIILVTNILGMTLPFILSRVKIDPAVASAPLIASVADAIGLLIYFSIAIAVLGAL